MATYCRHDGNGYSSISIPSETGSPRFLVTQLLGKIFHQAVVDACLKENQEFVITISSSYNNRQRQAVMEAASRARHNVVQLLNESTTATISYDKAFNLNPICGCPALWSMAVDRIRIHMRFFL